MEEIKLAVTLDTAFEAFKFYVGLVLAGCDPRITSTVNDGNMRIDVAWTGEGLEHSSSLLIKVDGAQQNLLYFHEEFSQFATRIVMSAQVQNTRQALGLEPLHLVEKIQSLRCIACGNPIGDRPMSWLRGTFPEPDQPIHETCLREVPPERWIHYA